MARDLSVVLGQIAAAADDRGVTYRQGVVAVWNPPTTTSVTVGGRDLTDLPRLSHVTGLVAGDVVALLRCGGSLLIIGEIVKP